MVRFPICNLDPLRFTVQNGNEPRPENGTETENHSQEEGEDVQSSPPSLLPKPAENTPEQDADTAPQEDPSSRPQEDASSRPQEDAPQENPNTRPQDDATTRPEQDIDTDTTAPALANGEGGNPTIIAEPLSAGSREAREVRGSIQDELGRSLHRREGCIYNLVSITVSLSHTVPYFPECWKLDLIQQLKKGGVIVDFMHVWSQKHG